MKKWIISLLCVMSFALYAQEYDDIEEFKGIEGSRKSYNESRKVFFKLSLLFASVDAEVKLSERFSLEAGTRLGTTLILDIRNRTLFLGFQPVMHLEPKWNYNIKKRERIGKNISKLSSNFLSLHCNYNVKVSSNTYNYITIGPAWGLQRNFGKYGYFKFKIGAGYRYIIDVKAHQIVPLLNMHLGFIF